MSVKWLGFCAVAAMMLFASYSPNEATTKAARQAKVATDATASVGEIKALISRYFTSVDRADTTMAQQIFSPNATFIHPGGEDRSRAQIESDVYRNLMGGTFSKRTLTAKDISVHVYGDTAWAEFNWDFVATVRKDGSAFHSQGQETDIFHREGGQWRIVHIHYSGAPVTVKPKGS
jgi:uncharacterized protein (TIGR02246 family)